MQVLRINDKTYYLNDFNNATKIINDTLIEYFDNNQCYHNRIPFSIGVLENELYDNDLITDEQIIIFNRICFLLNRLCESNFKSDNINHNYIYNYIDDYNNKYVFKIVKEDSDLILDLKVDCNNYINYLKTNMFSMKENHRYYFMAKEKVIIKSKNDKYNLGDVVSLDIFLNMV